MLRRTDRFAFTLIELLTAVAALFILMGVMVSLATYVRNRSATGLTGEVLVKLDLLMRQYVGRYGELPPVEAVAPAEGATGTAEEEAAMREPAAANNRAFVRALRQQSALGEEFADLPASMYDELTLHDAWGTPIVLVPRMHPLIGMAPGDRAFFFSAGPDRRFLTREDNLYSYDRPGDREAAVTTTRAAVESGSNR